MTEANREALALDADERKLLQDALGLLINDVKGRIEVCRGLQPFATYHKEKRAAAVALLAKVKNLNT